MDGDLPVNHAILGNLQDVFNLLPNLSSPKPTSGAQSNGISDTAAGDNSELARAMSVKTNDQLMAIYLSSLIRAITAFHDLIENKIQNRQTQEKEEKAGEAAANGEKDGEKANGVNGEVKEGKEKEEKSDKDKEGKKKS